MTPSGSDDSEAEKSRWTIETLLDELQRYFLRDAREGFSRLRLPITATRGGPELLGVRGNLRGARHLIDEQLRHIDLLFATYGLDPDKDVRPADPPLMID
jgi:hypothetical protein